MNYSLQYNSRIFKFVFNADELKSIMCTNKGNFDFDTVYKHYDKLPDPNFRADRF